MPSFLQMMLLCFLLYMTFKLLQTSRNNLNKDLERISNWATQWKTNFNPDTTKQAQEVIFSRKVKKKVHPPFITI